MNARKQSYNTLKGENLLEEHAKMWSDESISEAEKYLNEELNKEAANFAQKTLDELDGIPHSVLLVVWHMLADSVNENDFNKLDAVLQEVMGNYREAFYNDWWM